MLFFSSLRETQGATPKLFRSEAKVVEVESAGGIGEDHGTIDGKTDGNTDGNTTGLPADIDSWGADLKKRWEAARNSTSFATGMQNSTGVQILLGVPSCPGDGKVRQFIRDTWGKPEGEICSISQKSDKCKVALLFFVGKGYNATPGMAVVRKGGLLGGKSLHAANSLYEDDVLELPVPDGARCYGDGHSGRDDKRDFHSLTMKMFEYFKYASRNFKWATHIGRVDQDYLPNLHEVIPAIARLGVSPEKHQYLGKRIASHNCATDMSKVETYSKENLKAVASNGAYCTYGSMYFLSRKLAEDLVEPRYSIVWDNTTTQPELDDRDVGRTISRFAAFSGKHVETFTKQQEDAMFANMN